MAFVLVDFDTQGSRDFDNQKPIGVWLTLPEGGVAMRYFPEVEDAADPGHENYLHTYRQVEEALDQWRSGEGQPDFPALLEYVSETTYLGRAFRTFGEVDDDMTIDVAFDRFVVEQEPLPVSEVVIDVG